MAKKSAHDLGGMASGAVIAALLAGAQPSEHVALEVAGGALGGWLGSRLPDLLDPPTTPNHRSAGHGALSAIAIGRSVGDRVKEIQRHLRVTADDLASVRATLETDLQRFFNLILEWICRLLAGAAAGVASGYASHLVLDMTTPRGLPLLVKGF